MEKSYQVIARRWRPRQFDEIAGQDHIVRTLKNAILTNRIAHAYLFVGPRGTGKTSTARIFAKALNCEGGPSAEPDDASPICQSIMAGNCMDVIEIDGASNNSVDQVRDLRQDCQYAPAQCQFKIYIIDEVHMLSAAAFNALLKTLEEPPGHVKFIFATTEAQKVLPTIVSRCQRFEFRPIADEVIVERLGTIAEAEGIDVERAGLFSIARLANGGMRDSQSIFDQMISFCGNTISEADVLDVYGLTSPERIEKLALALAQADYPSLIDMVDVIAGEGRDLYRALLDLQSRVRQALLDAIRENGSTRSLGEPRTTESLLRMLDALHAGEASVQKGLSEKVNFEVTLLRAVEQSRARAVDSLIKELTQIANGLPEEPVKKKIDNRKSDERSEPHEASQSLAVSTDLSRADSPSSSPANRLEGIAATDADHDPDTLPDHDDLGAPADPTPARQAASVNPLVPTVSASSPVQAIPAPDAGNVPQPDDLNSYSTEEPPLSEPPLDLMDHAFDPADELSGSAALTTALASATKPQLSMEEALAKVPAEIKKALEEKLAARFREVRRL